MNFKLKENGLIWENYANIQSFQKRQKYSDESEEKEDDIDVEKSDLNNDGHLSTYEKTRGLAISDAIGHNKEESAEDSVFDDEEIDDSKPVVMSFDADEPVKAEFYHDEDNHDEDNHDEDNHDEDNHDEDNHERNEMIKSEVKKLREFADRLEKMSSNINFEEWMVAKITKAADYTSDVYFRLSAKADYANGSCDYDDNESEY